MYLPKKMWYSPGNFYESTNLVKKLETSLIMLFIWYSDVKAQSTIHIWHDALDRPPCYLYFITKRATVRTVHQSCPPCLKWFFPYTSLPCPHFLSTAETHTRSILVHVWFSSLWKLLLKQVRTVSGKETVVEAARKAKDTKSGSHDTPDHSNLESEHGNVECKKKLSSFTYLW